MKRSGLVFALLALAFVFVIVQPEAWGWGTYLYLEEGPVDPRCWVTSLSLKNIDSHLPNPSASYVFKGRCELDWSTNQGAPGSGKKPESTFDKVKTYSVIEWTAQGTYQPVEKNTWEDITLTQTYYDRPGFSATGVLTGWMLCGKDPWRDPDPAACGAPGFKTTGTVDKNLADFYKTILKLPITSLVITSAQRATLKSAYQAAVQAATKKANDFKVVAVPGSNKVAQNAFNMGPAPTAAPPPHYPEYGATYTPNAVPGLKTNQTITVPVKLLNGSASSWPANGIYRLAYHWKLGGGFAVFDGARTFLPTAVASGNTIALNAKVVAPGSPGAYVLQWDLVQEGVTWFSWKGVPTEDQNVSVTP